MSSRFSLVSSNVPSPGSKQAHKPTSVTHSVVGNFTHDNELNLIVA